MPTPDEWEAHRPRIVHLFVEENHTVQDIVGIMKVAHGFEASNPSYERKLRIWNVKKNKMGDKGWKQVEKNIGEGKQREVYCDGVLIPSAKLRREISRYGMMGRTLRGKYAIMMGRRSVSSSPEPSDSLFVCPPVPIYQCVKWDAESPWLAFVSTLQELGSQVVGRQLSRKYDRSESNGTHLLLTKNLWAYEESYTRKVYTGLDRLAWERDSDERISSMAHGQRGRTQVAQDISLKANVVALAIRDLCLSSALKLGRIDVLEAMLSAGVDVKSPVAISSFYRAKFPLQIAAEIKDEERSLQAYPEIRTRRVSGMTTVLGLAARTGSMEMCKFLLVEKHADIDAPRPMSIDDDSISEFGDPFFPLTIACNYGHIEIVRLLIENGASIPLPDQFGLGMAPDAAEPRHSLLDSFILEFGVRSSPRVCLDVCELLIQKGAPLDSALWTAIESKNLDLVRYFLAHDPPLHAPTWFQPKKTPLGLAIESGDVTIARAVYDSRGVETGELKAIPKQEMMDFYGESWVSCSTLKIKTLDDPEDDSERGDPERNARVRRILEYDINLSGPGISPDGPLEDAIYYWWCLDPTLIEHLLQRGAPVGLETLWCAVWTICENGRVEEGVVFQNLNLVLKYIPDAWKHGSTEGPLNSYIKWDAMGYFSSSTNDMECPAIILAAEEGLRETVQLLLKSVCWGARIVGVAYTNAIDAGKFLIAEDLLEMEPQLSLEEVLLHKADPNGAPGTEGASALQYAAMEGNLVMVHKLLDGGADVNQPGSVKYGRTTVEGAAEHGRLEVLDLLLRRGGKIACSRGGKTHTHAVWLAKKEGAAARLLMSQKEFAHLEDDSERPPCSDDDLESESQDHCTIPITEYSESGHDQSLVMDDVEMARGSEASSAGVAEVVENQNDPSLPDLPLDPELSMALLPGEEAAVFANEAWKGWPEDNTRIPGVEDEHLVWDSDLASGLRISVTI
ncbi:hypothetical protein QBC38DRAFT_549056 [Podospora fimiseda]|uniref:Clr5 domain-containing protein n=1 Tax=Podospora fimiseda TaxID=252190 RepID=A0AAN6YRC8_9PEZI|nr:hypothetical protein QBC38DRAFT_549056 [Podospora fimiseda]